MSKNHIHVVHLETLQSLLCSLDDTKQLYWYPPIILRQLNETHCFLERPPSFGPLRRPQNSLVVTIRSVRRIPRVLIDRPLKNETRSRSVQLRSNYERGNLHGYLRFSLGVSFGRIDHINTVFKSNLDNILAKEVYLQHEDFILIKNANVLRQDPP